MEKEEILELIKTTGTCEDEATRRENLTTLADEVNALFENNEQLTKNKTDFEKEVESLREANMKLFLKVSEQKSESERKKDDTGIKDEPAEKRKFENLFDEKGGIK